MLWIMASACALATAHVPTSLRHLRIGRRRRRRRLRPRGKGEASARGPLGVGAPTPVTLGEGPMGHRPGGVLSARTSACACLPTPFLHLRIGRRRGGERVGLREDDTSVRDFLEVGAPVLISPFEGRCEGPKGPPSISGEKDTFLGAPHFWDHKDPPPLDVGRKGHLFWEHRSFGTAL